jgi:hypothetical protein
MIFTVSENTRQQYETFLQERSMVIHDCTVFLNDACETFAKAYRAGNAGDLAVIALTRHVVESLDGASHLVAKGSVLPCYMLLRSVFDAWLGVMYILKADSNNRGLAYFYFQISQDKAFFERLDPTTNRGKEIRRELQNDIAGVDALDIDQLEDVRKQLADLNSELTDPMFEAISKAWEKKPKNEPQWYSLFDNSDDLRKLAINLGYLSFYERDYRPWCRQVHATGTLANLSSTEDAITSRPIRHPGGIHKVVKSAGILAITLAGRLLEKHDSQNEQAIQRYKDLEKQLKSLENAEAPNWSDF